MNTGAAMPHTIHHKTMFTSLTDRSKFGATYEWAVLSVLPMDSDKSKGGLRVCEVNRALGMPKEARTTATLLLKRMASEGLIRRYEYKMGKRPFITYKRLMPLRKRERIARWIWG
jgi:hypothetical protein